MSASIVNLRAAGIYPEEQLSRINTALANIDQKVMPSTLNNIVNARYIMEHEREIISVLSEAEPQTLNFLITRLKLGLLFYKVKDHRSVAGQHRTELIELLAVNRISQLNVVSRATVLDALMMMKMTANTRAEFWVKNLIVRTSQVSTTSSSAREVRSATIGHLARSQIARSEPPPANTLTHTHIVVGRAVGAQDAHGRQGGLLQHAQAHLLRPQDGEHQARHYRASQEGGGGAGKRKCGRETPPSEP